jgi:hypothetical protein
MTHTNLETDIEYALVNKAQKIVFRSNTLAQAEARRDKVNPEWSIIEITTSYRKVA